MVKLKKITLVIIIIFFIVFGVSFISLEINKRNLKEVELNKDLENLNSNNLSDKSFEINKKYNVSVNVSSYNENLSDSKINNFTINSLDFDIFAYKKYLESKNKNKFLLNEVSLHNTREDCYLVINNNVYDVSSYISFHPGGSNSIISRCGKEVTSIFARIHSNRAWDLLKKYKIGEVISNKIDITKGVLDKISEYLVKKNPGIDVIKVSPKKDLYIVKIAKGDNYYEVHINNLGEVLSIEGYQEENDWSNWQGDLDDNN